MTVENSPQLRSIGKHCIVDIGSLYFFDNFLIAEFNEGANIDFENFRETQKLIRAFFGNRSFGFVANRINSYSINLMEAHKFNLNCTKVAAYAIITYNSLSEKIFEIENHFFKFNRKAFKNLDSAIVWADQEVEKSKLLLN